MVSEILIHLKAMHQDVHNIIDMKNKKILLLLPLILCADCKARMDYPIKSKYYDVTQFKSLDKNDPVIFGNFKEFGTEYSIAFPVVKYLPETPFIKGDVKGNYKFSLKPGKYHFTGAGFPYPRRVTKTISVKMGDSIRINFYLPQDAKPL